jgi:hypothetical protein
MTQNFLLSVMKQFRNYADKAIFRVFYLSVLCGVCPTCAEACISSAMPVKVNRRLRGDIQSHFRPK